MQPTRGMLMAVLTYGEFNLTIIQPTRGTRNSIRGYGRQRFFQGGPEVRAPLALALAAGVRKPGDRRDLPHRSPRMSAGIGEHQHAGYRTNW